MTTNLSIIIVIHHRCIFIPEAIMAHQRNANLERMHGACAYDASRSISNVPHTHNQTHIQTAIAVYFFYFSFCFVHNTLVMVGGCCWFSFPFCRNSSTSSFLFFLHCSKENSSLSAIIHLNRSHLFKHVCVVLLPCVCQFCCCCSWCRAVPCALSEGYASFRHTFANLFGVHECRNGNKMKFYCIYNLVDACLCETPTFSFSYSCTFLMLGQ